MTSLRLSTREQEEFRVAQEALLSPLVSKSPRAWQIGANHAVRRFLGADHSVFVFPPSGEDRKPTTTDDTDPAFESSLVRLAADGESQARYRDPFLERVHRRRLVMGEGAYHLEEITDRTERAMAPSFQEIFVPYGFEHLVALSAQTETGAVTQFFGFGRSDDPGYGGRGAQKLRLLVPAFAAGVRTNERWMEWRGQFLTVLESIDHPLALYDGDLRRLHQNRALENLLGAEPLSSRLEETLDELAGAALDLGRASKTGQSRIHRSLKRRVKGRRASYRLSAFFGPGAPRKGRRILVQVEPRGRPLPGASTVREAYGLTPRETTVAFLLAEGLSDKAIAQRLDISWHTVRTHVRNILRKVDVSSRRAVAVKLFRGH